MFITINGHLGSGKSTVCSLLQEQYGFKVFNTGSIQREFANKLSITTLELNKISKDDLSFDYYIDNATVEYAKAHKGESVIFDSRLAWHFVPDSFKVRLTIDPQIAASRVFNHRQSKEENYATVQEAMEQLSERQNEEAERYQTIYGIDINDVNNYDYIIDTSDLAPTDIAEKIVFNYKEFIHRQLLNNIDGSFQKNFFISKEYIEAKIPYENYVSIISIDVIIQNSLDALFNANKENANATYYDTNALVISDFQNCAGKEATQRIVVDLLSYRTKNHLPTHLICNLNYSKLKFISEALDNLIRSKFIFLS